MFEISFGEIIVIGVVALVVIGPERLPKVARTVGAFVGRLQRYISHVKADIQREVHLGELRQLQSDVQDAATNFESQIKSELNSAEKSIHHTTDPIKNDIQQALMPTATRQTTAPDHIDLVGEHAPPEAKSSSPAEDPHRKPS